MDQFDKGKPRDPLDQIKWTPYQMAVIRWQSSRSHTITKTSFGQIYTPDTSSNNVVSLQDFDPPSDLENLKGYMIRRVEDGRRKYICLACGKSYTTEYNLKKHRQLHLGKGLHSCSLCGYSTGHKHAYDAHMRLHSGEKPYKCDGCGKRFSDRSNFRAHKKRCIKSKFAVWRHQAIIILLTFVPIIS